jgi:hypothetical protein
MREMLTESRTTEYSFMPLSNREVRLYNPLYAATELITDPSTGTLNGTGNCDTLLRSNISQQRLYLNPETPFYVVYKNAFLSSNEAALLYLKGLFNAI